MKNTSQQGLISQTAVLNRLVQMGYEVLLPWDPSLGYDLAYYTTVDQEVKLVRVQVKTARLSSDGCRLEFNTSSVVNGKRRSGVYVGKAEYFAAYSPDTGKIYMIEVDKAPKDFMRLRFKSVGVIRSNGRQNRRVPYEEAVASGVNYWWAEDYEI